MVLKIGRDQTTCPASDSGRATSFWKMSRSQLYEALEHFVPAFERNVCRIFGNRIAAVVGENCRNFDSAHAL